MRLISFLAFALLSLRTTNLHAESQWDKDHPRRTQVNQRLKNQQKRVNQGLANGQLNTKQAARIQNQDARIHQQERRDAAKHGGHITKGEQRQLNRNENHVSREIHRDEGHNAAAGAPASTSPPAANP